MGEQMKERLLVVALLILVPLLVVNCTSQSQPENFASVSELEDWLAANTISEEPISTYADTWYRKAIRLQQDALADGYIISADYDYDSDAELYSVWCVAVINGSIFYWDPETDEVLEETGLGAV